MSKDITPNKMLFNKIIKKNFSLNNDQANQYLKSPIKTSDVRKLRGRNISNVSNNFSSNSKISDKIVIPNSNDSLVKLSDLYKLPEIKRIQESPIKVFSLEEIENDKRSRFKKNLSLDIENKNRIEY